MRCRVPNQMQAESELRRALSSLMSDRDYSVDEQRDAVGLPGGVLNAGMGPDSGSDNRGRSTRYVALDTIPVRLVAT